MAVTPTPRTWMSCLMLFLALTVLLGWASTLSAHLDNAADTFPVEVVLDAHLDMYPDQEEGHTASHTAT